MNKVNLFRLINQELWVSIKFLLDKKVPKKTIYSGVSTFNKGKSIHWESMELVGERYLFIRYQSITINTVRRYSLPKESDIPIQKVEEYDILNHDLNKKIESTIIKYNASINKYWRRYFPYYEQLPIDDSMRIKLAKTHVLVSEIIQLSRQGNCLTKLFDAYKEVRFKHNLVLSVNSYSSFHAKIKRCKEEAIEDVLPHALLGQKSNNLVFNEVWQKKALHLYAKSNNPSKMMVYNQLNDERISMSLKKISYSTIRDFLSRPIINNQSVLKRYGVEYFNNTINPYISRYNNYLSSVWEMDGSKLPFLVKIPNTDKVVRMSFVIIIDVYSNRIIGFSLGFTENADLVLEALLMAFSKTGQIPSMFIHDKGTAFTSSKLSTIKEYTYSLGSKWKTCKAMNPKEKGKVERTIGTLKSSFFKQFDSYLGEGIKSKREHAHPSKEKLKETWKKENLNNVKDIYKILSKSVLKFNSTIPFNKKQSPNEMFKEGLKQKVKRYININEEHIALMFYNKTTIKIKQSTIQFDFENKTFKYVIPERYRLSLNGTRVIIYYNPKDTSSAYIFNANPTQKFICKVQEDYKVSVLKSDWSQKEKEFIKQRAEENKNLKIQILENLNSIENEFYNNIDEIPSTAILPGIHDKELVSTSELNDIIELNQINYSGSSSDIDKEAFDINRIVINPINQNDYV